MPSENKHVLPIPDKIEVKKTPEHVQISGTKIFIIPPKGSKQDTVNHKIFIDNVTDIYFLEYNAKGFSLVREEQVGRFLLLKEKNPAWKGLLFHKYFMLGKDSAAVMYGIDPKTKAGKITWLAGGSTYSISAVGTFPPNQTGTRDEILAALQSIYIDTAAYVDYAAISHYTADTVTTGFKQYHRENDIVYYTNVKGGGTEFTNSAITPVPIPLLTDKDFEDCVNTYLQNNKRVHKLEPLMVTKRRTTVNGLKAIECSFLVGTPEGQWKCLFLVVTNGKRSTIFSGSVPLADEALFDALRTFAGTIRMTKEDER